MSKTEPGTPIMFWLSLCSAMHQLFSITMNEIVPSVCHHILEDLVQSKLEKINRSFSLDSDGSDCRRHFYVNYPWINKM